MKILLQFKELYAKCNACGAIYLLNRVKDFRKIKWNKCLGKQYGIMKCKCCKQPIWVNGAHKYD